MIVGPPPPVEALEVGGDSLGKLHSEDNLGVTEDSGSVAPEAHLVGEARNGGGQGLSSSRPSPGHPRKGEKDQRAEEKREAGEDGSGQEKPLRDGDLPGTVFLSEASQVPHQEGHRGQAHICDEGQGEFIQEGKTGNARAKRSPGRYAVLARRRAKERE